MTDPLVKVLKRLGVSFDYPKERRHYRFENETYMPLVVEQWMEAGRFFMSVSHYGYQGGDAMADPDILYEVAGDDLLPVHYQNDYLGVYELARKYEADRVLMNPALMKDILVFTRTWARNIKNQYSRGDLRTEKKVDADG